MYQKWEDSEINFIKEKYESGLDLHEVYDLYLEHFGNTRTKNSVLLVIKRKGFRHTNEQKRKIRSKNTAGEKNGMFGKESWTRGKTKETSEKLRKASEKNSETRKNLYKNGILNTSGNKNGMFGKDAWNVGKNKFNDETMKRIGESVSVYQKNKWQNISQNERDEIIGRLTKCANKNKKDTKIEKIVENLLINNSIAYEKQYKMGRFVTDFFIPQFNLVIECQGDYWHANPDVFTILNKTQRANIKRDSNKKEYLDASSVQYLFFWESEIKNHIDLVLSRIMERIKPTFEL